MNEKNNNMNKTCLHSFIESYRYLNLYLKSCIFNLFNYISFKKIMIPRQNVE